MMRALVVCGVLVSLAGQGVLSAQEAEQEKLPAKAAKAVEAVEQHVARLGGRGARVTWKSEKAIGEVFPGHQFVVALFRQFPVARVLPEGLDAVNLYAVDGQNKLEKIKNWQALEKFFKKHAQPAKSDKAVHNMLTSFLALGQEFHQDGMYKFEILDKGFAVESNEKRTEAAGRAIVMQGGNGEIAVNLLLSDGQLTGAKESAKIRPGPRPICQATKLLDADPLVRRIAEQDLLIMGRAAQFYLEEQRARATPELRQAIDRVWSKIQANGW